MGNLIYKKHQNSAKLTQINFPGKFFSLYELQALTLKVWSIIIGNAKSWLNHMIWRVTLLWNVKHARVLDANWLTHGYICSDHVRVWVAATVVMPIDNAPGSNSGVRTLNLRRRCNVLMISLHITIKDGLARHELTMRYLLMISVLSFLDLKCVYRRLLSTSLLVITLL